MDKRRLFLAAGAVLYAAAAICYSSETAQSVREAVNHCLTVIIPALYAFMIASSVFVSTGLSRSAGRILWLPAKLFGINGELMSIFLISQIGGYPCGTIMLCGIRREGRISAKTAALMQYCCFGSGPAFLLGISQGIYPQARLCVFLAGLTANIMLLISLRKALKHSLADTPCSGEYVKTEPAGFTQAVCSAAYALLKICAMIIAFASVRGAAAAAGITAASSDIIGTIWEVSSAETYLSSGGSLPWAAALLSFGGICVISQLSAIDRDVKIPVFIAVRCLCAAASYALCHIYLNYLCNGKIFCSAVLHPAESKISSIIPSIFLFIMTMLLLSKKGWTNDTKSDII